MRAPSLRARGDLEINMTPMIDIVFLLIIFFLVNSHLAKQDQKPLDVPAALQGRLRNEESQPQVILHVSSTDGLELRGAQIDEESLTTLIAQEKEEYGADIEVLIRSDRRIEFRHVEPALRACAGAGVWNVGFAVQRER